MKRWDAKTQTEETIDPGVTDRRLMIIEPEFANALAVMERPGKCSTLIAVGCILVAIVRPYDATGEHVLGSL